MQRRPSRNHGTRSFVSSRPPRIRFGSGCDDRVCLAKGRGQAITVGRLRRAAIGSSVRAARGTRDPSRWSGMAWGGRRQSAADRRLWERSNAITAIRVPPSERLNALATRLAATLATGDRPRVQAASQALLDAYCALLGVPRLQVEVEGVRPTNHYGELHGLYRPGNGRSRDRVQVWMHTARRAQVVAFKTFLRTLLHELSASPSSSIYRRPCASCSA